MADFLLQLDGSILLWIQSVRQEWMTPFWKMATFLGDHGWFWIVLALSLMVLPQTRRTGAAVLLALSIGALITNILLKPWVARVRPYEVVEGLTLLARAQKDYSFPSGHSCAAFASASVCRNLLPRRYGIPVLVLAILIACSRLYLGVHYPSDVLGGILAGTASGWAAVGIFTKINMEKNNESRS